MRRRLLALLVALLIAACGAEPKRSTTRRPRARHGVKKKTPPKKPRHAHAAHEHAHAHPHPANEHHHHAHPHPHLAGAEGHHHPF